MIRRAASLLVLLGLMVGAWPILGSPAGSLAGGVVAGRVHSDFQPNDGRIFILVIGNDARSGNPNAARADAIHLVGINVETMRGGVLNFPRDSWVNIPGHGSGKINESLYDGGPELVARTVESLTGIHIDYWVMTGFVGFVGIMKDIGGVKVRISRRLSDIGGSGAVFSKGVHKLKKGDALAYVRDRHDFPHGDIDRTTHQGRFLILMLRKLKKQAERDPAAVLDWMATGRKHTRFDLSADEMFRLGVLATQLSPRDVGNVTVPVSIGSMGAASVVFISARAHSIYARFRRHASL